MILGTSIETYLKITAILHCLLSKIADFMTFLAKVRVKFRGMVYFQAFSTNIGCYASVV